jgi:hypothetical protein
MKKIKKATVVALTSGVEEMRSPEELRLHNEFMNAYHNYCDVFPFKLTVREYVIMMVEGFLYDETDVYAQQYAKICLQWTKMEARHGHFTSLLNKLGEIIGENIVKFA